MQCDWGFCGMGKGEECESSMVGDKRKREGFAGDRKSADMGIMGELGVESYKREWQVLGSDRRHWNGEGRSVEGERKGNRYGRSLEILKVLGTTTLMRNKAQLFPITRRPQRCLIPTEDAVSQAVIDEWFASTTLWLGI